MSFQVGLFISLDMSPENRLWVGCGVVVGFAYGYFVGEEPADAGRILSCGLIGGIIMGLVGNIILWSETLESRSPMGQDLIELNMVQKFLST